MKTLYLSYDGLMEQLGQSQVLPYLLGLAKARPIILITFEKKHDFDNLKRRSHFKNITSRAGIRWIPLRYHSKPSFIATAYDVLVGLVLSFYLFLTNNIQIIHCRGYISSVIALCLKKIFRTHFIFDMRGFWIDQRIELGIWQEDKIITRFARWLETGFLHNAKIVFALSSSAVQAMKCWPAVRGRNIQFEVVTTCTNLDLFKPLVIDYAKRPNSPFTLGYVGNAGRGYRFDPVLEVYLAIKSYIPNARLKIVNRNDHFFIRNRLEAHGIEISNVDLKSCDYPEMPSEICDMDLGVFFYEWKKAHVSSVPTRMGEFLACGVPCISDVSGAGILEVLQKEGVGVVLPNIDPNSIRNAALQGITLAKSTGIRSRCVDAAQKYFSLDKGISTYEKVYRELEEIPK